MDLPDKQLLDAAPDAMVVVNANGEIVLVNRQTESLFGYSRDELLGQRVEVLMPKRLSAQHTQHRQQFFDHPRIRTVHQDLDLELIGRRKDGSEFHAEISLSPVKSDTGLFVASAIRDITDRIHEDQKLKQLLDSSADSMVVVDPSGTMVLVNTQTEAVFGYQRSELLGNRVEMLLPERFRASHPQHRAMFFETPRVRAMGAGLDLYGLRKNGDEFPIEISLSPVQTAEGPLVSSAIRDITAHKEAERALEIAKDIAESATATKSRFLAAASHDLRQPLQSLGLYLSVATRQLSQSNQVNDSKLEEVGNKMRKSLDTMGELLDALLDISKLDAGSITPEKRDVPIHPLLDRIVTNNIQQAEEKGLVLEYSPTNCIVSSDPRLLERILDNFVTNAIRYTDRGRVTIRCQADDSAACIAVSDTGIGIPAEKLDKVFEEYYQLDNPVRDRRKGLGLGLSIVKHIAHLLDHPLKVISAVGEGSTFSVDVPLSVRDVARVDVAAPMTVPGLDREPVVLFVDDDPAIIDATTLLLGVSGFMVHTALNGDEALAHIADGVRPDIVISDFRLPGDNGVEVVQRVRKATVHDLPIVLMTGDTSSKEIESANLSNCTIMHKPVEPDTLISLIGELTS